MSPLKTFDATRGVLLDADFAKHAAQCDRCRKFSADKPATAVHLCLEGAVLFKRDNVTRARHGTEPRSEFYASKAEMKRLTRYKGEL